MTDLSGSAPERRFDLPLSEIRSQSVQDMDRYWRSLCRGTILPARNLIDPAAIKHLLPGTILVDIERDPFRVKYRLVGTLVVELCGNLTGRYLDEFTESDHWDTKIYLEQYWKVATERRPVFGRDWMVGKSGARHTYAVGIWPLASDGQIVDMCMALEDYFGIDPEENPLRKDSYSSF